MRFTANKYMLDATRVLGFAEELCWRILPDRKPGQLRYRAAPAYYVIFDPQANQHWVRDLWSFKLVPCRDIVMGDDSALKSILLLREGVGHPFGAGGSASAKTIGDFTDRAFVQWGDPESLVFKAYEIDPFYGQPTRLITLEPAYNDAGELVAVRRPPSAPTALTAGAADLSADRVEYITLATE